MPKTGFVNDLEKLINYHSLEGESRTPDWILARYLQDCLTAFNLAVIAREEWYAGQDGDTEL